MIPKIKKVKHYKGTIYRATQELRDITRQLSEEHFEEFMKIFGLKHHRYSTGGGDWTDLELVDSLSKSNTEIKKYPYICLIPTKGWHYYVEATNDQLISLFSRLDNLKAFL